MTRISDCGVVCSAAVLPAVGSSCPSLQLRRRKSANADPPPAYVMDVLRAGSHRAAATTEAVLRDVRAAFALET